MHIQRHHEEHHPFPKPGHLNLRQNDSVGNRRQSSAQTGQEPASAAGLMNSKEVEQLVQQMRELSPIDEAEVQLAQARFQSGELLTREAAELVATSLLRDFHF